VPYHRLAAGYVTPSQLYSRPNSISLSILRQPNLSGFRPRRRLSAPSPIGRPPQHGNITPRRSPPHAGKQHSAIALITEAAHGITLLARSSSNIRKNISSVSTASWNP